MSTYEEELYKYLTKKENFISAIEISSLLSNVKEQLILEFWTIVQKFVEQRISESTIAKYKWQMTNVSEIDIFERWSAFEIWFSDDIWVGYSVLHGKLAYGLLIDPENKKLDRPKIDEYVSKIDILEGMKNHEWWLARGDTNEDFSDKRTLIKTLPENREDFAKELADRIYDFGEEMRNDILKLVEMTK